jgi:hypothetical protein
VLTDEEIVRQIGDFEEHGVYAFMIHPRVGLPRDIGWLSDRMIHCMHRSVYHGMHTSRQSGASDIVSHMSWCFFASRSIGKPRRMRASAFGICYVIHSGGQT